MVTAILATPTDNKVFPEVFENLDLEPIKYKLMNPESDSANAWTLEKADCIAELYIMFLALCKLYPDKVISPSREVDTFWHYHILDTHMYHKDCNNIFGYYLHHFPYFGVRSEEDAKNLQSAFEETQVLYKLHFNVDLVSSSQKIAQCNAVCGAEYIKPQSAQCNAICGDGYINDMNSLERPRPVRV